MSERARITEEPKDSGEPHSRYLLPALREIRRRYPDNQGVRNRMRGFLTDIDQEGIKNYNFYEPPEFPGVRIPFTRVNVGEVARNMLAAKGESIPEINPEIPSVRERTVIYPAYAKNPNGHPFDLWGAVYDSTSAQLQEAVDAIRHGENPNTEIYAVGLPHGFSGKVTTQWHNGLRIHGFDQYGEAYAGLLRSTGFIPEDPNARANTKYTFEGYSMGGPVADATVHALPELEEAGKLGNVEEILYIPTGFEKNKKPLLYYRRARMGLGIQLGLARLWLQKEQHIEWDGEPVFKDRMIHLLQGRGIDMSETAEERELKDACANIDVYKMARGTVIHSTNAHTTTVVGGGDLVNAPFTQLAGSTSRALSRGVERMLHPRTPTSSKKEPKITKERISDSITVLTIPDMPHNISFRHGKVQEWVTGVTRALKDPQPSENFKLT